MIAAIAKRDPPTRNRGAQRTGFEPPLLTGRMHLNPRGEVDRSDALSKLLVVRGTAMARSDGVSDSLGQEAARRIRGARNRVARLTHLVRRRARLAYGYERDPRGVFALLDPADASAGDRRTTL